MLFCNVSTADGTEKVKTTGYAFSVVVPGSMEFAQQALISALEGKNYMIVNTLNVQQGLRNKGITVQPLLLVEFINLSKAYTVTQSNEGFELFAPLRAALFQRDNEVHVLMLRPRFIESTLEPSGLSAAAKTTLHEFDDSMKEVMEILANGGF